MGNVRNPVGPLPSSIYWRRRAVVLCLLAIVVALVVWAVVSGRGSGGGSDGAHGSGGHSGTPVPTITPGPTSSGPAITTEPGGRTSGGTGAGGASAGASAGSSSGASAGGSSSGASSSGGTDGGGTDGGAGTSSGGSSGGGSAGSGARLPVGTPVPDCSGGSVRLQVRSVHSTYAPGQRPTFAITAVNSGDASCKVNFSAVGTVVTVTDASGHHVWASADCPPGRTPYLLRVPAGGSTIDDVDWDRTPSAPQCATPVSTGIAGSGTYHVRVAVPGLKAVTTSFKISG